MLDFVKGAREGVRIRDDHIVFSCGKLEFEHRDRAVGLGLDRLEKNDILEHPPAHFVKYCVAHDLPLAGGNLGKALVVHQRGRPVPVWGEVAPGCYPSYLRGKSAAQGCSWCIELHV